MIRQQVKDLSGSYPPPAQLERLAERLELLQTMAKFYRSKAPDSRDGGKLFEKFADAAEFSVQVINKHRNLTNKLAALAEGEENEIEE